GSGGPAGDAELGGRLVVRGNVPGLLAAQLVTLHFRRLMESDDGGGGSVHPRCGGGGQPAGVDSRPRRAAWRICRLSVSVMSSIASGVWATWAPLSQRVASA